MRYKSIFEHRWFSPEAKPGERPRESYRVFWTVSFLLAGISAAYLKWGETFLNNKFESRVPAAALSTEPVFDKDNFLPFEITKIEPYNLNTKLITFATPKGQATNLPVASALFARSADEDGPKDNKGNLVVRWYTPVSDASIPGQFTLMIKKYDDGKLTPHIHSLKVGDKLAFKGPIKKWAYKMNEFDQVGLIGGGSGITPLYQILGHALKDKNNKTKFTLLYGNLTEDDILLRKEFDTLKKKYPDTFNVVYFVDKKTTSDAAVKAGYIGKDDIHDHLKPELGEKIKVFVCGPPPQMKAISGMKAGMKQGELSGALKDAGFTEDQVYKF